MGTPSLDIDDDPNCPTCGGDGYVYGYELDDPLWYEPDETYRCENCRGSGLAKDCTVL